MDAACKQGVEWQLIPKTGLNRRMKAAIHFDYEYMIALDA